MLTIAICSTKGSPGVTTLACALGAVWPAERRVVVGECDPSGGDLAARFGLSAKRGMTSLVLEARRSLDTVMINLDDHVQVVPGGLEVLAGPTGAGASNTVDAALPDCLERLGVTPESRDPTVDHDLVLDCGRIQSGAVGQSAVIGVSDQVLVVARPTVEAVASTLWIAERLHRSNSQWRSLGKHVDDLDVLGRLDISRQTEMHQSDVLRAPVRGAGLVLVGNGPVVPSQAATALGLPLLAVIPEDGVAAAALRGEPVLSWRLARSALVDAVRGLVSLLLETNNDAGRREQVHATLAVGEARL